MADQWVKHTFYTGAEISMMQNLTAKERDAYAAKGSNCALCGLPREECERLNTERPPAQSIYV